MLNKLLNAGTSEIEAKGLLTKCEKFFDDVLLYNDVIYWIAIASLVLAVLLALRSGLIDLRLKANPPVEDDEKAKEEERNARIASPVLSALSQMVTALATAPAWLFLLATGLLALFAAPMDLPQICSDIVE